MGMNLLIEHDTYFSYANGYIQDPIVGIALNIVFILVLVSIKIIYIQILQIHTYH